VLTAYWIRNEDSVDRLGTLRVIVPLQYEKIKAIHNAAVGTLNRQDLCWELTAELNSDIQEKK